MEFVKVGKNYLIKGSNGRIVDEKTKLQLENKELVLQDIKGCGCQQETTKKISKNKKRIKEIMEEEKNNKVEEIETYDEEDIKETAQTEKEVDADDTIQEANSTL